MRQPVTVTRGRTAVTAVEVKNIFQRRMSLSNRTVTNSLSEPLQDTKKQKQKQKKEVVILRLPCKVIKI